MDLELIFVLGCVVTSLSISAILSAFSDGRTPRYPAVIILISYAVNGRPGAFNFDTSPDVFAKVIGRYIG